MNTITVTTTANLATNPELRYTPNSTPVASLRLATSERRRTDDGRWENGPHRNGVGSPGRARRRGPPYPGFAG